MGNTTGKIVIDVKKREYGVQKFTIPYGKLEMIRVLQREFDYEVKGTIYVDDAYQFKSFEVRSDESATFSYGASDWRIYFHTHPDKTAQKYGVRYFSPPSVDDVIDIYDLSTKFVPTTCAFGEISIIFTNEGLYVMRVARKLFNKFNKENLPIEVLTVMLNETLTPFMVNTLKHEMIKNTGNKDLNLDDPEIGYDDYIKSVKTTVNLMSKDFGFHIEFHGWTELEKSGLEMEVSEYFLNKKVND
jgi:hypothetical protein